MNLRIRAKFIGILVLAAGLPLLFAVLAIEYVGHKSFESIQGESLENEAWRLATELATSISNEGALVTHWIEFAEIAGQLERLGASSPPYDVPRIQELDSRWPSLGADSPEVAGVTASPLADSCRRFMELNPTVREMILTDREGRLVAASGKTSDYWQGDEEWWLGAMKARSDAAQALGVVYDASAKVHAVNIVVPIRKGQATMGVAKAVVSVGELFAGAEQFRQDDHIARLVVFSSGERLARVGRGIEEKGLFLPEKTTRRIVGASGSGWFIGGAEGRAKQIIGFSELPSSVAGLPGKGRLEVESLFVVAYRDWEALMTPIRTGSMGMGLVAILLTVGFGLAGLYIANRKLLGPIERTRGAARVLAAEASLDSPPTAERARASRRMLDLLKNIRTGDELEELACEFSAMAEKVIGYHSHLEQEIARRTEEIQRDLEFAKEFQLAMMPSQYPVVGSFDRPAGLRLNFHHLYRPASSMGGDFCNVLKLSEQRASVFIADVMGHGSRSALVTAILATLMQNIARRTEDPGRFLELINREFSRVARVGSEPVFATAFYLLIDTGMRVAAFASAGHPPPLVAVRGSKAVHPLMPPPVDQPALGLFPESNYKTLTRQIGSGETFVMFTDGAAEAEDADGRPFGVDRIRETILRRIDQPIGKINKAILHEVIQFTGSESLTDDVCIVGVDVITAGPAEKKEMPMAES